MKLATNISVSLILAATVGIALAQPGRAGVPNECGPGTFDSDCDDTPDAVDNCMSVPNGPAQPNPQCDTDQDGYGNVCDADVNNDGGIGNPDYAPIGAYFGQPRAAFPGADVNCDGGIGNPDYAPIGAGFGGAPGPSGLSCAGTIPCP